MTTFAEIASMSLAVEAALINTERVYERLGRLFDQLNSTQEELEAPALPEEAPG